MLYWNGWLSSKGLPITIKTLREAFGWIGKDVSILNGTDELVGLKCKAKVENEEYKDKVYPKIRSLYHIESTSEITKLDEQEAKDLAKRLLDDIESYDEMNPYNTTADNPF
jgi:hypothetical protein